MHENSPYDQYPDFYQQDNRQYRGLHPITKESLDSRMATLLPEWLVKGRSILDLGSCLGAAGQWALYYGAKSYTGVEIQTDYATLSQKLLAHWGEAACVHTVGIREYLDKINTQSFDIILAAGVIYLFIDPKEIIDKICNIASEVVIIESKHNRAVVKNVISPDALMVEYRYDQGVNLANARKSLEGIAANPTFGVLDLLFRLNGFYMREPILQFPVNEHSIVYTSNSLNKAGLPPRYAVRFFRNQKNIKKSTLEENLPTKIGIHRDWASSSLDREQTDLNQSAAAIIQISHKQWAFNADVASNFDTIAETSIPHYHDVIKKTVDIVRRSNIDNPKIIDIGSATGNTLRQLHEAGFNNLFGVDNSTEMLTQSFNKATLIHSNKFPMKHGPFDIIICNWVLHFIHQRGQYLKDIADSLGNNGILILSEKVTSSTIAHDMYHDFKRQNGLSEEDIKLKQQQLAGVLDPYPLEWYFTTLRSIGFNQIDIIDASYVFVTILAQR